ncbi:MAG: phytoene desaturase [Candidatus Omnitrophica bacterium]|nr:phytoene desaturase [Candidatus Omnitrophota bacterium]
MAKKIAIIGAGLGGLSAALCLAARGYSVDIFEKNRTLGGKAGVLFKEGFRFDTGPSLLTMPFVFEELLARAGKKLVDYFNCIPLDPVCKYYFRDGTILDARASVDMFAREVSEKTCDNEFEVKKFLEKAGRMYDEAKDIFLRNSLEKSVLFMKSHPLSSIRMLAGLDVWRTLHASHAQVFKDRNTIQLFDRYATYSGSNPYQAPATLNIIPYIEYGLGAFLPDKGIAAIPDTLEKICKQLGVRIHCQKEVQNIITKGSRVKGIVVEDERIAYDSVVSNVDVHYTYSCLLNDYSSRMARRYSRLEPSSSGVVFYWGMGRTFKDLCVNNIIFSEDYRKEFDQIFRSNQCPDDPTIYINITSKHIRDDAPAGKENWFVLVNVPYDSGQDWEQQTQQLREITIAAINKTLKTDIASDIICEEMLTPSDIYKNTHSNKGSIYGVSSNTKMAAFYRQPNRSRSYEGLYFCGGSVHPGGGMPLVALSGMIAADLIIEQEHD